MQLVPTHLNDLTDIIRAAVADDAPLTLSGNGTKAGWGRAVASDRHLSLRGFSGIIDYAPAELVMTVGAGTPLADITRALEDQGQHLAFEPMDLGPLFGNAAGRQTIGGVLACNLAGPRRPFAGAARDYFLGFTGVNGAGEVIKAGGKVVKNVTGYDLPKIIAGSFGTLVALTEVTLKVVPAPETSCSILVPEIDLPDASALMIAALASTADPSGAAYLPSKREVIFRLEGSTASVAYRRDSLITLLRRAVRQVDAEESVAAWQSVRNFQAQPGEVAWLLSLPITQFPAVVQRLQAALPGMTYQGDWGGGRLWLSHPAGDPAAMQVVRGAVRGAGHATLLRAPEDWRRGDDLFMPDVPVVLLRNLRAAFDPARIFNRGRLHPDL